MNRRRRNSDPGRPFQVAEQAVGIGVSELARILGPAETVETSGMVRPLRIAEIGPAVRERIGLQRSPDS